MSKPSQRKKLRHKIQCTCFTTGNRHHVPNPKTWNRILRAGGIQMWYVCTCHVCRYYRYGTENGGSTEDCCAFNSPASHPRRDTRCCRSEMYTTEVLTAESCCPAVVWRRCWSCRYPQRTARLNTAQVHMLCGHRGTECITLGGTHATDFDIAYA